MFEIVICAPVHQLAAAAAAAGAGQAWPDCAAVQLTEHKHNYVY